jgi:hypothetical protein
MTQCARLGSIPTPQTGALHPSIMQRLGLNEFSAY